MSFSSWKLKRNRCCPKSNNLPQPPQNLIIFEVFGYNYRTIPNWANGEGRELLPLQFFASSNNLSYEWRFYKPYNKSVCDMTWLLSTSDDIVPQIYEQLSKIHMKVTRLQRYNGNTLWKITC